MTTALARFRTVYGSHPLHLLVLIAGFAVFGAVIATVGLKALWNPNAWYQSIAVWFAAAVIFHDLVLFPAYALADRVLVGVTGVPSEPTPRLRVPVLNYLRVPALGSALTLLLFLPGIIRHGKPDYLAATGQTQEPFLGRWLLLIAVFFGVSAIATPSNSWRRAGRRESGQRTACSAACRPARRLCVVPARSLIRFECIGRMWNGADRLHRPGLPHLAFFLQPEVPELLIGGREREYFSAFINSAAMHDSGAVDFYARSYARPGRLTAALSQYRSLYTSADDDRRGAGPKLRMPTLALSGEGHTAMSADGLRRVAQDVTEVGIAGGGHYTQEERPIKVADTLDRFLTS